MAEKQICSICFDDFKQAVTIDCGHSFCFICLEDYVNKASINKQFQCPLCRRCINLSDGGLDRFKPKPINITQCDVCTEDTCQYFCRDCDQYLCKSCKTMHDKLQACKEHVVCRYGKRQIYQATSKGINAKDFCLCHEEETVKVYCKDCAVGICWKCFVADHNGHKFIDLQEKKVGQSIRHDLNSMNNELKKQITIFQKHNDNLNSKLIEIKNHTKTECDKVDAQIEKICAEFHKMGDKIKKEVQKDGDEEESKFRKLMEDIKRLILDLKASFKKSVNVLEDSSIVQVLQSLDKIRQEKDESCCRKLDIPDVRYSTFQVAEINETLLTRQLGKIVNWHQNIMFQDYFDAYDLYELCTFYRGEQHVVSGFTWHTGLLGGSSLHARLFLGDVEDKSITACKVDVTYKLINKTDRRQSVVKKCNGTVERGGRSNCYTDLIDWKTCFDPIWGYLDGRNNFLIETTINKITDIKRR